MSGTLEMPAGVQPFRAGRLPGEAAALVGAETAVVPEFATSVVLLADISEFQPDLADAAYLRWSQAIVIRALYGTRTDKAWFGGARRDALHAGGAKFVGIYAYITAGEDPAVQARALIALLGKLRPGEKVIADIEEGAGSQQARWVTWADTIHAGLGDAPWDYSGEFFASAHGLAPVTWVASYGSREPSGPHQLWQFTDSYRVPGLPSPVDCSVFHGDIGELAALAWQPGKQPVTPVKPQPAQPASGEEDDMTVVLSALPSGGPATALPVPAGKTKLVLYADGGVGNSVPPVIRVGTSPTWNGGGHVTPAWGTPAVVPLPKGTTLVSITRADTGTVPVAVGWE